ncbi:MAG: ribulose-phosphate 3-epimerase [Candidatus Omnitrophota bacterium]|jgi:ribulose-phosphate 3-epimerase|nr:MAG: ribulose-phosphate 3-epimerase [Candidatus Omnitrophota bacterium]
MKIQVSPSILSADFSCLGEQIKMVESSGADMIHVDVMDGNFVPNITIGPVVVKDIRKVTKLPIEAHLMIERPQDYIEEFIKAGADIVTLHIEAITPAAFKKLAVKIRRLKARPGISLNPSTPLSRIKDVIGCVDFILVMSVRPGFSGQSFIPRVLPKIKKLRSIYDGDIAVDGGINEHTGRLAKEAGANILVAASYIFKSNDVKTAIERMKL